MTDHTPGPWYTTSSSPHGIVHAEGTDVPIVPHPAVDLRPRGMNEEQWANARLISAAPELLKAVRQFLVWLDINGPPDLEELPVFLDALKAVEKAQAGDFRP